MNTIKKLNESIGYIHQVIFWTLTRPLLDRLFDRLDKSSPSEAHGFIEAVRAAYTDERVHKCIYDSGRTFGICSIFPLTLLVTRKSMKWVAKDFLPVFIEAIKDHADKDDELTAAIIEGMEEGLEGEPLDAFWSDIRTAVNEKVNNHFCN
jgi:hypothetical protein